MDGLVVYFSNVSENTHRFVEKLGVRSVRIPLGAAEALQVDEPYVLVVPTYGSGRGTRMVPVQVTRFLNDPHNRSLLRGVVASGNTNFGADYCRAGDVISAKCQVPLLYRFELLGSPVDVRSVQDALARLWGSPLDPHPVEGVSAVAVPAP